MGGISDISYVAEIPKFPEFAARLAEALEGTEFINNRAKINQTKLAKELGIAQPTARDWVLGLAMPGMDSAVKLAVKIGVCVEWLLTGRGSKAPDNVLPVMSEFTINVVDEMTGMSAAVQEQALNAVKAVSAASTSQQLDDQKDALSEKTATGSSGEAS